MLQASLHSCRALSHKSLWLSFKSLTVVVVARSHRYRRLTTLCTCKPQGWPMHTPPRVPDLVNQAQSDYVHGDIFHNGIHMQLSSLIKRDPVANNCITNSFAGAHTIGCLAAVAARISLDYTSIHLARQPATVDHAFMTSTKSKSNFSKCSQTYTVIGRHQVYSESREL
jgi:hypothetical protein